MWLKSIEIQNFRNYEETRVQLADGLNVLEGRNGSGKTNFLEAVGLLSHGKSIRIRNMEDLIKDGEEQAQLRGIFENEHGSPLSVTCLLDRNQGKRFRVNGKSAVRISDIFRLVPTVQCFEQDTYLLQGAPAIRRTFIDCLCAQLYPDYLRIHRDFRDALKQRNAALRRGSLKGSLKKATDAVFAQKAAPINLLRRMALNKFSSVLEERRQDFKEDVELTVSQRDLSGDDSLGNEIEVLLQRLERASAEEAKYNRTSVGPHRDSFSFKISGGKIRWRSSRGQIKNMVLRIKMAEYHLLRHDLGRIPIVILDDVFAEMDEVRRGNLENLLALGAQVFWASTGLSKLKISEGRKFLRLEIDDGIVSNRKEILAAA